MAPAFLQKNILYNKKLAAFLWFSLSLIAVILEYSRSTGNNFLIFKGVFEHTILQKNLYLEYPAEYADVNLYGPVFSLVIAPFALLPVWLGVVLWVMFNATLLYIAIQNLPIADKWKNAILILSSVEMMNSAEWMQSNAMICACLLFGFLFINRNKEVWALFFILLATFIKLYGIVGFTFFLFSKNKGKFIFWTCCWSVVFFVAPMIISSKAFIIQSYTDWYERLQLKDIRNTRMDIKNDFQDISVMGMLRRIFHLDNLKNIWVTLPAIVLFATQLIRIPYYKDLRYRLYLLCSVLITTIIFTTSSESPTYIIAFPAVCIWYILQPPSKWVTGFFIFALLLTSFSYSDIFTPYVRTHIVRPYSLKALPCFIMWLILLWQIWRKDFLKVDMARLETSTNS